MKIAILTLPLHVNYGGILQCYALQTVLERMGHEARLLIRSKYVYFSYRTYCFIYPLVLCKRLFTRFVLGKKVVITINLNQFIVRKFINHFIRKNIHCYSKMVWNSDIASRFDAFVVGSDQVWRPIYYLPIEEAFLSFLGDANIKRIAYAASFGVDHCEYTEDQKKMCSSLLKGFNAVSVRESSGIKLCKEYFDVQAVQVLDPTLLLSADDYRTLIRRANTQIHKDNMLVYMLDRTKEKEDFVEHIAQQKGLSPFWMSNEADDDTLPLEKRIKMPVEQWLRSFDDAEFVLTDSFHGCIFSIIFKKQFLAIGNKKRGLSRFTSLLASFSLQDRLILSPNEYNANMPLIDYDQVQNQLHILQNQSISFLKTNIC